ncbi:MAG: hypothetical protein IT572_06225 [Deltaproteobacteria bacterium]|nr:hypothetical protein [Deltaproteobacteria bacterium]
MQAAPNDLVPIPYSGAPGSPELEDEAALLLRMAVEPLDSTEARNYVLKKYLIYLLIAGFCFGLPLAVFGAVSLSEWGLPRWVSQAGIWISLAVFFIFFLVTLALIASRGKVYRTLGLRPVSRTEAAGEGNGKEQEFVAMEGARRGRTWEYGMLEKEHFWRCRRPLPPFQVAYLDGAFCADASAPAALKSLLAQIPPKRHWRRLRISAGAEGLRTARPAPLAKYSVQDLWLAEKILETLRQ